MEFLSRNVFYIYHAIVQIFPYLTKVLLTPCHFTLSRGQEAFRARALPSMTTSLPREVFGYVVTFFSDLEWTLRFRFVERYFISKEGISEECEVCQCEGPKIGTSQIPFLRAFSSLSDFFLGTRYGRRPARRYSR